MAISISTLRPQKNGNNRKWVLCFRRGVSARMEVLELNPASEHHLRTYVETNLSTTLFAKPKYLDRVRAALD